MSVDIAKITAIVAEVAVQEILPRFRTLAREHIQTKSHAGDLVTEADLAAERELTVRLTDVLPGSVVVGEEATYHDPLILDRLADDAPVWVIDPVDGTRNFANGHEAFASVVALVHGGRTLAGWIHDPITGVTAVAEQGSGAWEGERRLRVGGQGMRLSALTASLGPMPKGLVPHLGRTVRLGSAAHDYKGLAEGRLHVAVYRRLMPWDHAAGVLLHQEAGGVSALIDQTPYVPTMVAGTLIVAPDEGIWQQVASLLGPDEMRSQVTAIRKATDKAAALRAARDAR